MYRPPFLGTAGFLLVAVVHGAVPFEQVQTILISSCVNCHSGEKAQAELRLDTPEGLAGAVVPGDSTRSPIFKRIIATDPRQRMPLGAPPLKAEDIATLRAWIDGGALLPPSSRRRTSSAKLRASTGGDHWAYRKPIKPAAPEVKEAHLVRNPIDRFLLARLEREGLTFSPEASKETLIRRVSLDLVGLPPSPKEIDEFLADTRPDAYERLVDRLLASPRFGERWARPWLDLARYADSNGFREDRPRTMWKYRDWVIDALNKDMPFDQFTIEQIAGDLLPGATASQKVATGFHRNTMLNEEDGVDKDEAYFEVLVDRVNTTATVWLGTTLGCAQCHDHKYDPFTQKDYYQFMAFFNNTRKEIERYESSFKYVEPELDLPSPDQEQKRREIAAQIDQLEARLRTQTPELVREQAAWERAVLEANKAWQTPRLTRFGSAAGAKLTIDETGAILASGENAASETFTVEGEFSLPRLTGIRIEALPHPSLPHGGPGRDIYGNFLVSSIAVEIAPTDSPNQWKLVQLGRPIIDDGRKKHSLWTIDASREERRLARQLVLAPESPVPLTGKSLVRVSIVQDSDFSGESIGRFRISVTDASDPSLVVAISAQLRPILEIDPAKRTSEQAAELYSYYRDLAPSLSSARRELRRVRSEMSSLNIPTALVMAEQPGVDHPSDFVRVRGTFLNRGPKVYADVPAALPPLGSGCPPNRLGLARWLVTRDNPLTARVTVNRIWEQYFGRGIVETSEDFGSQGERPVHPELLDWLATEFVNRGWSMKAIHRLIVTSTAYRQTSQVTPELLRVDPYNRLISRGARFRMEAEMIRDSALASSGLLSPKIGGPSVFPPQPQGVWDYLPANEEKWVESKGEDRYRRGIYTFVRRAAPYPALLNFDAPSREICTVRRVRTNTPLQALTTLNDRAFFETARALAARMLSEGGDTERSRVDYGFRLVTGRFPKSDEMNRILAWQTRQREYFTAHSDEARRMVGDGIDSAERASWAMVANILLNLDEALTKE